MKSKLQALTGTNSGLSEFFASFEFGCAIQTAKLRIGRKGAQKGVEVQAQWIQGVATFTTGLSRTDAPSRLARTRTLGFPDGVEFDA